jgi:transposase InsO family protein
MVERGLTERTACRVVGIGRTSYRYREVEKKKKDEEERERIKELAQANRRYGYRRITALLRREGWRINPKRTWRLWKEEGLKLPRKRPKRRIEGKTEKRREWAKTAHEVWSMDFVHDKTERGRTLRFLPVLDEYTRECLGIGVKSQQTAEDVKAMMENLIQRHGKPEGIRFDNGPEFQAESLKRWMRTEGIQTLYIEPGSPWENGCQESFNGKLRDECLNMELFYSEEEAQVIVEAWRKHYNQERPHSALGYRTPAEVARSSEGTTTTKKKSQGETKKRAPINP